MRRSGLRRCGGHSAAPTAGCPPPGERGKRRLAIAVLTGGNPSHRYGTETERTVTARLIGRRSVS